MISPTALAVAVWGSVAVLGLVFAHLIRSLRRGADRQTVVGPGVDR